MNPKTQFFLVKYNLQIGILQFFLNKLLENGFLSKFIHFFKHNFLKKLTQNFRAK